MMKVAVAVCLLLAVVDLGLSVTLDLVLLPNAQSLGAVCNDGSPAGFYYRGGDPNLWVVHLQGGGWCYDQLTCEQRMNVTPQFMTSTAWKNTYSPGGLFSGDCYSNPDWCKATFVYIPYCTSDSFSGSRNPSPSTYGWYFRGKTVLKEVLNFLNKAGLAQARQVLLSGCSAGGAAVIANSDYVASLLPNLPGRVFKAHADAGWFLDFLPMTNQTLRMNTYFIQGQPLWGGIPNAACAAAYPNELWKCYMGQYAHPYIQTPMLVHQETEDFAQLLIGGDQLPPFNTENEVYLNDFRTNITQSLMQLNAPHAVFAPACYWHCNTESDQFWGIQIASINDMADRDALYGFFFGNTTGQWIDNCIGFSCSIGCPANPPTSVKGLCYRL